MSLHPEIAAALLGRPAPVGGPLDPVALRAAELADVLPIERRRPLHSVQDQRARWGADEVTVRVYTAAPAAAYGLLVYLHGGSFFLGSIDTHDHIARSLAAATGLRVISVDYRLAPESAFPAGLHDCYAAVRWAGAQSSELGWDGRTFAIAGDGSGGGMAASVAGMALDDGFGELTHQVLYYPSLDLDFDEQRYPSLRENGVGYGLETASLKPYHAFYLDSGAATDDPLVSPMRRRDLTGLPPALIVTAQLDPLRDEGEHYAERLRGAGVHPVVLRRYAGAPHGFVQHYGWIPDYAEVFDRTAGFLRSDDNPVDVVGAAPR